MAPREQTVLVEAYVETLAEAERAVSEGATRLELCGPGEGGLTPSVMVFDAVRAHCAVPVHLMVRPRAGNFVYDAAEFELIRRAIAFARGSGADGVVLGVLRADATLDVERMEELVALARPLRVICHRAFDETPDADAALEQLLALGVHGVLTAGQAPTALGGAAAIARHVRRAGSAGRPFEVIAGGSVRGGTARRIVEESGVGSLHARATAQGVIAEICAALGR